MDGSVVASTTSPNAHRRTDKSVMSFRSFSSGLSRSISNTAGINNLKMERNLLERMVQERDEKIGSLQKSIEVQKDHVNKLQAKIEISERRVQQVDQRHKLKMDNLTHEKNMLKSQLKVMHNEIKRINDDPIHRALNSQGNAPTASITTSSLHSGISGLSGSSPDTDVLAQIMPAGNPFAEDADEYQNNKKTGGKEEKVKLANSAQGLLLQSQLYNAMNSLKQLRQQTSVMKQNYDEVVISLQKDLVLASDDRARIEAELLSQLSLLEQDKKIMQKSLEEKLAQKDARIKVLEKRVKALDKISDDQSVDIDDYESDLLKTKSFPSALTDARLRMQPSKQVSILDAATKELETPYSSKGEPIFRESGARSTSDAAAILIERTKSRAAILLSRSSSRPPPPTIVEEDDDDVQSQSTLASDAVSEASSLLKESRMRAMKLLQKTAPGSRDKYQAISSSASDDDLDLR